MPTRNKYSYRSKLENIRGQNQATRPDVRVRFERLQTDQILHLNHNTVKRYFSAFRERIARFCETQSTVRGEVEVDESYFGPRRVKGVRGLGAQESVIHSDGWHGYVGLVDLGYQKHFREEHSHNEFANSHSHINGIESFWAFAKTRLPRLRGMHKHVFYFNLKEYEFRFNNRREDIAKIILVLLKNEPIC